MQSFCQHTRLLHKRASAQWNRSERNRTGFTLVELLIVISILAILLTMTVMAVNFTRDSDRVSGAAGQIQSFLNGARDRAIYAKAPRGVRFFLDPTNALSGAPNSPRAVSSMVYIDPAEMWSDGVIQLQRWDFDNNGRTDTDPGNLDINQDGILGDNPQDIWVVAGAGTAWWELKRRGMLFDGMRIRIPKGPQGSWYPVNTALIDVTNPPPEVQKLILAIPYRDPGDTPKEKAQAFESGGPEDYEIQLPPRILPMEPVILPQGTVIDLDGSKLPDAWKPFAAGAADSSGNLQYSQYMDVVFSPRGTIIGSAAAGGIIHLYVCDSEDSMALKEEYIRSLDANPVTAMGIFNSLIRSGSFIPADEIDSTNAASAWATELAPAGQPYLPRDRRIVTIFTQTGAVSVHPINATDSSLNGFADDPFFFAETGESAK